MIDFYYYADIIITGIVQEYFSLVVFDRNKKFDRKLSDKYDGLGKRIAKEILRDLVSAVLVSENLSESRGDFSCGFWDQLYKLPNGKKFKVESEIKDSKWYGFHWVDSTGYPFQFDTMDIPYRKHKCVADVHLVISSKCDLAFIIKRSVMDAHLKQCGGKPKFKKTKYEPDGAYYFSTPLHKGVFVFKDNGKWKKWEG